MLDLHTRIAMLKRPNLLVRAARFGVDEYRRDCHLPRILQSDHLPRTAEALMRLLDMEQEMDAARRTRSGAYAPSRHVDLLIAISGEARLLRAIAPRLT